MKKSNYDELEGNDRFEGFALDIITEVSEDVKWFDYDIGSLFENCKKKVIYFLYALNAFIISSKHFVTNS